MPQRGRTVAVAVAMAMAFFDLLLLNKLLRHNARVWWFYNALERT